MIHHGLWSNVPDLDAERSFVSLTTASSR